MEKLNMKTEDLASNNIAKLSTLFPEIITEVEKGGKIINTINVDKLKELIGDYAENSSEVYELTWVGKQKSRQNIVLPIHKTLRPVVEDSVDFENTENLYIEGDNFEVLKLLQESYLNKIKMIYIDPPYNTGKDFIYKDNFAMSIDEYDEETGSIDEEGNKLFKNTTTNGRFHSVWLSMMFERLVIAKDLLRDDGVIFISIDDNEVASLRKICDEVFGEGNFISQITREAIKGGSLSKFLRVTHDYVLIYTKQIENVEFSGIEQDGIELDLSDEKGPYAKGRELNKWGAGSRREDAQGMYYPIKHPNGAEVYPIRNDGAEGRWRLGKESMHKLVNNGDVIFEKRENGTYIAYEKIRDNSPRIKQFISIFKDEYVNSKGTEIIKKLFNVERAYFDYSKPIELIVDLMKMGNIRDNDIILDFFSGSATTAHAVMQLNAEDGGNRKFIMVQLPEPTAEDSEAFKAGYRNIAEIGKERIKRAAKKIREDNKDKDLSNVDFGFRLFKTDSSNMKDVYYNPNEIKQRTLTNLKDNIKEDRTDKDLLFQILLELTIPISAKITEEKANNKTIYRVNDNFLIACFDDDVDLETIKKIAQLNPLRIVFKDSSFEDDAAKVNCDEYLKNKLPNTIVKVI